MKLQYSARNSMGTIWIDCQDRFDDFVSKAAVYHGHTAEQIINGLERGCEIKTADGWDATKIRDSDSRKYTDDEIRVAAEKALRESRSADGYGFEEGEF